MKLKTEDLNILKQKFPKIEKSIVNLLDSDDVFNELCLDYCLCVRKVNGSRQSTGNTSETIAEYENLINDLETEIVKYLSNHFKAMNAYK